MYAKCASRRVGMFLLCSLLPNYLARRIYCSNGPNDVWYCDGYDKIKQYGFPIHCGALWIFKEDFVVKSSQIKQQSYRSSGLSVIKEQGFCPNL